MHVDPISLEVFRHRCAAIAEEMGKALGRTAFSANIKERRDYSCAIFDANGHMIAQAAHIPVHLGAMPRSVEAALAYHRFDVGDIMVLNDPYLGGSHLPDITMVAPIFVADINESRPVLLGYVASRAHHADVGGMSPGSMPMSHDLYQEGLIIPPVLLQQHGTPNHHVERLICRNSRTPDERKGDLAAQRACHTLGQQRFRELVMQQGIAWTRAHMEGLLGYGERSMRALIADLPNGTYRFEDVIDDDGCGNGPLPIRICITIRDTTMTIDFTGTAPQTRGPVNAPVAVAESAIFYCLRCLGGVDMPDAAIGAIQTASPPFLEIIIPEGSLLNPRSPAPVAGGNVETSQRVVDVVLGAFAQAIPDRIPAASAGTMNNWTFGGVHPTTNTPFAYYETLGGGGGGRPHAHGIDGLQVHMTNTLNTPVEALEQRYPVRVHQYALRPNSGGKGRWRGGDGLIRDIEFLAPATVSLLTERRLTAPYGLQQGEQGACGRNLLICADGSEHSLPAKGTFQVEVGDHLRMETPGGGGWGEEQEQ